MATTGHESEIIQVQGLKASLQKFKTDILDPKVPSSQGTEGQYLKSSGSGAPTWADMPTKVSQFENDGAPKINNQKIDLRKPNLRILEIGNSYSRNIMNYLRGLLSSAGITSGFSIYHCYVGGGDFYRWDRIYKDLWDNTYTITKEAGDKINGISTGTGSANDGSLFRSVLNNNWDLIIIHQVSGAATKFDYWDSEPFGLLGELIEIIKATNPQAAIGFHLIHSLRGDHSSNTEGSSLLRWLNIAYAVKRMVCTYGIDIVIPYGTAVQNMRMTSVNDSYDFSTDGLHLASGVGEYVAACSYFQTIFAPRYGVSVLGNTFRVTDLDETISGVKNVNDSNALLAQKAAILACSDMYNLYNPLEKYVPTNTSSSLPSTVNAVTTVLALPLDRGLVIASIADGQTAQSFTLSAVPSNGSEIHVMVDNSANSSGLTITIPHNSVYVNTNDMASGSMTVAAGKVGEINIVCINGKVWIRYIGS